MAPSNAKFQEFESVFRHFDENGDGKLSPIEEAEALVYSLDLNSDALLDFEEFIELVNVEEEDKESEVLKEAFGMYVMEGEGYITAKSLKKMLSQLGASRGLEECMAMIHSFDLDGDGVLSFEELKLTML